MDFMEDISWMSIGSAVVAGLMFIYTIATQYFPEFLDYLESYSGKVTEYMSPYIQITFDEYAGDHQLKRNETYTAIQSYLSKDSSARAMKLKANVAGASESVILSMDHHQEITDSFNGVTVWWQSGKKPPTMFSFSFFQASDDKRFYKLTFHIDDRKLITEKYIDHVIQTGKTMALRNRQRKLYLNNPSSDWSGETKSSRWSHVPFEHSATFDTLAMEKTKKEEIKRDLIKFSESKDYYKKIGKTWKRGYLLFGPPGTGKSTTVAAMANLLEYDIYDLELTAVQDNTELKRLLIDTTCKSIIVIEDIDCSLDLTGQRSKNDEEEDKENPIIKRMKKKDQSKGSKVTLSGLLNFIDGLWSACGGERVIVFTTNFIDKLDPALIRRGRMDKHIEMSYCCFEAFEMMAKNYLDIEWNEVYYGEIKRLLEETEMTPADVGENLLPKWEDEEPESCLKRLVDALKEAKEEGKTKKKGKGESGEIKEVNEETNLE